VVIVYGSVVLALAGCGGGGSNSEATPATTAAGAAETVTAGDTQPMFPAADCAALGGVLSDIKIESHRKWLFAYDIFPTDYGRDRDVLDGLRDATPSKVVGGELLRLRGFVDAYASAAQAAGVEAGSMPSTQNQASTVWQSVNAAGVDSIELRLAIRTLTSWAAGGCSDGGPPSDTTASVASPAPATDTTTTDTTPISAIVNVGETVTWNGDTFTVSDVKTSDTAPVADLFGEKRKAEKGVWLSFKIAPEAGNSGIWSLDFTDNIQIKGGDGVVYDRSLSDQQEQALKDEGDFLVWIDIPEAAASGAVLEINDGLHTVDPDPSNPFVDQSLIRPTRCESTSARDIGSRTLGPSLRFS
jgi:hypothetical protein